MDFLKFISYGYLVDEEATTPPEPKIVAFTKNTQDEGEETRCSESGVPHSEDAIGKEIIQEGS